MSPGLTRVPVEHRLALEKWIARVGLPDVASCLSWLATHQLHHNPQARLYGLSAPELLVLVQDLQAAA